MALRLHVVKGKQAGQVYVVPDEESRVIGRSKNADITLDDALLSRTHLKIEIRDGVGKLTDLASSNGSYLNGEKVKETRLASGDKIKNGGHILLVELLPVGAAVSGAQGSAAAAAGGYAAIAAVGEGSTTTSALFFCGSCHRAVSADQVRDLEPGRVLCADCAEGKPFDEDMIDGFKILGKLGEGKIGAVYKAKHLSLMKFVALKVVRSERAVNEQVLKRFMREAKIGGRLFHPNIVEMYDAAVSDGHYSISMEYVEGETLDERIRKEGKIAPDEAIRIGTKIADALRYAFEQAQIVHRNVKPANIFLGRHGEVKLADFGLAKSLAEDYGFITPPGEGKGTLHYISPEQMADARAVDQRTDVYALGATMYHALAGAPPFDDSVVGKVIENIVAGRKEPLAAARPDCPPELAAVVEKALEKDRYRRFATAGEMLAALKAIPPQTPHP